MVTQEMIVSIEHADSERSGDSSPARYPNLRTAGRELAGALRPYRDMDHTVVLGIVSGGVPVAYEVARDLNQPFDLIIRRTLAIPRGLGSPLSAAYVAGVLVVPEELKARAAVPSTPFEYSVCDALTLLGQREQTCRRGRPGCNLAGQNVIVVDCGIRTGLTMQSAIFAVRSRNPAQVIAAVPVGSVDGCGSIATIVDKLVSLAQPEPFGHAGMWYDDFARPEDDHIHELLDT